MERLQGHPEANTFSLLIVALLERGEAMTLAEVAARFEDAGVAQEEDALRSLKRCRPARDPVYRDGDRYGLDPHSDELDFWAFRLGLRPAKWALLDAGAAAPAPAPAPPRVPGLDEPITLHELEEALRNAWVYGWSSL
ncbi:MAG: hypothetical protein FIA95_08760, partial [Gemmatimonadetes bacterium]|nr:hypothetical protein [Gemmatimonadota bacterium]